MYTIGIDLGGTNIAVGLVKDRQVIVQKTSAPTRPARGRDAVLSDIAALCKKVAGDAGVSPADVDRVGIAVPGGVDTGRGRILFTPNIPFSDFCVTEELSARLDGLPVRAVNDANAAALAETLVGAGKGAENAVMITLGTGVGGGIVIGGKLYTGANGLAAELGHFVIQAGGVPCGCGRKGCFEAYGSATALVRMTREELDKCFVSGEETSIPPACDNAKAVFAAYADGDSVAARILDRYTDGLACGVTSLINIFQPDVLILGGGVSGAGQPLLDLLRPKIDAEDFARTAPVRTRLCLAACGNDAGILGAALLD
ncbi:MAG: ROK family protein [Clostridia bacterium]|nr:ROK family protein [Clostridia bacterium]